MFRMPFAVLMLFPSAALARAQESAARFDAPLVTTGDRYAFLTDFDHDGFQDVVSWWWWGAYSEEIFLSGRRNDGTGKFVPAWGTRVDLGGSDSGGASIRVLPCQLDSDASTDICLYYTTLGEASIRVLRSNGMSAPEVVDDYSLTWTGLGATTPELHAVVTDFTGDGFADVACTFNGNLRLNEFVPGQVGLTLRSSTNPFGPSNVVLGLLQIDANGDATPDLLVWRDTSIAMVEVQDCEVTATQTFSTGTIAKPAIGDIDGDGDQDLVMWNTTTYAVARRTGPASWAIEPHVTGGPAEFLYDVDQDGDLDGVCCSSGGSETPENTQPSIFRVSVNDGTGAFAPSIETAWLGSDHLAGVADLDHDGDMDVVAGRCILYSRGPLTQRLHPLLGAVKTGRSMDDIDGDGDPDFTIGLRTMERNLGDGRLAPYYTSFPAPPLGTQFIGPGWPGDFDGDGDTDLVVQLRAGTTLLSQRLLTNLGGGAFADGGDAGDSGVDFNLGSNFSLEYPETSLAVDADGDGDVDLLTRVNSGGGNPNRFWWNDGAGYFTAGPEFLSEVVHWIGDLTGDGLPDIATAWPAYAGASYGYWGMHEGLGAGAFGARVELGNGTGGLFVVGDLDADGDLDIANGHVFRLTVYWNEGGGVFTDEWVPSVGLSNSTSHQMWISDVDDDGLNDLLIGSTENEPNALTVVLRKADNSGWETPFAQVVFPAGSHDAIQCDVDGDGDEDFVTSRLIRNATHTLPHAGRRLQFAAGTQGTGGLVPTLGADGPFRFGESCELRVSGGRGGAAGLLTVTQVHAGQRGPGGGFLAPTTEPVLAQIPFTLSGTPGVAGAGSWTRNFTVFAGFAGQSRRYVVKIFDPAAPGGVARSNALMLSYGP